MVVDGLVIVATAGRFVAYDRANGDPRWYGPGGGGGYSSPHLATLGGVKQVLLVSGAGAISVAPDTKPTARLPRPRWLMLSVTSPSRRIGEATRWKRGVR